MEEEREGGRDGKGERIGLRKYIVLRSMGNRDRNGEMVIAQ